MRKNVRKRIVVVFFIFHLAVTAGCSSYFPYPLTDCQKSPSLESCPPLPPQKGTLGRRGDSKSPYTRIVESWRGRHINELFKSWGQDFYSGVRKCPHNICDGYLDSVAAVHAWLVRGQGRVIENPLDIISADEYDPIMCTTEFAVNAKGKIIAVGLAYHGRGSIKKCDELIRTKQWNPTPTAAPG